MEEMENESKEITSDCEDCGTVDSISHTLTRTPHIVKDILSKLAARDLNRCSTVCRLWAETVKKIKVWRKTRSWMFYTYNITTADSIAGYIHGLYTEPSLLFMFCQTELLDSPNREEHESSLRVLRSKVRLKAPLGEYIKNLLPSNCSFIGLSTDGVVGTSPEFKTYELEYEKGISFMSLPKYDGVDVYTFTTDIYMFADQTGHGNGSVDIAQISTIPVDKDPKAILFFCDEPFCPPEIGYSLQRHYPDAVIAGGYVDNLVQPVGCFYDPAGEASPSLMCVAFCGDNVKVASVVIAEDVNNDADLEKKIKQLKACNFPEEKSFAFMFACVGRGFGLYGRYTVESSAFRKIFPKTPLVGFFGNGEVGFNHLPESNSSGEPRIKKGRSLQKLYHAYTTILCLVSVV